MKTRSALLILIVLAGPAAGQWTWPPADTNPPAGWYWTPPASSTAVYSAVTLTNLYAGTGILVTGTGKTRTIAADTNTVALRSWVQTLTNDLWTSAQAYADLLEEQATNAAADYSEAILALHTNLAAEIAHDMSGVTTGDLSSIDWASITQAYTGGTNIDVNGHDINLDAAGQAALALANSAWQPGDDVTNAVDEAARAYTNRAATALQAEVDTWDATLARGATAGRSVNLSGHAITNASAFRLQSGGWYYVAGSPSYTRFYGPAAFLAMQFGGTENTYYDVNGTARLTLTGAGVDIAGTATATGNASSGTQLVNYQTLTNVVKTLAQAKDTDLDPLSLNNGGGLTNVAYIRSIPITNTAAAPTDNYIMKYDAALGRWNYEADATGAGAGGGDVYSTSNNTYAAGTTQNFENCVLQLQDIYNPTSDDDITVNINDGGTLRTAIQVHGDEGSLSFPRQSQVSAYLTAVQTVTNATWTKVILGTEAADTLGEFASSTFTAKDAGTYAVIGTVQWAAVDANKNYYATIYVNGAAENGVQNRINTATTFAQVSQVTATIVSLTAGQTIALYVYQDTTGTEALEAYDCSLRIVKVK